MSDKERGINLPVRRDDYNFTAASFVLQHDARCYSNSPLEYQNLPYQGEQKEEINKVLDSIDGIPDGAGGVLDEKEQQENEEESPGDGDGNGVLKSKNRSDESVSRDIAAQEERIQWKGGDTSTIEKTQDILEGGSSGVGIEKTEGQGGGVGTGEVKGERTSRLNVKRLPLNVVKMSQIFSIVGGIGLVVLWSLVRRRRPGSGASSNGGGGGNGVRRGSFLLPMFMRPGRARRE